MHEGQFNSISDIPNAPTLIISIDAQRIVEIDDHLKTLYYTVLDVETIDKRRTLTVSILDLIAFVKAC